MSTDRIAKIDALLPQTQCGLCEYAGCKPYAQAIIEKGERIDRCLPGGINTLKKLGELMNINPEPYFEQMQKNQKADSIVVIREAECIGCTKCIQACPVDAIIGTAKMMHSILNDVCTGCDLCIAPCPVDCIDVVKIPPRTDEEKLKMAGISRERYEKRNSRLEKIAQENKNPLTPTLSNEGRGGLKSELQEILRRAQEKKKS